MLSYIGCLETHPCQSYQYAHQEISHWNRKQKVALRREQFAYVFQERNLLSHLTVKETLALYAEVPHEKIQAYMQEVKLTHRLDAVSYTHLSIRYEPCLSDQFHGFPCLRCTESSAFKNNFTTFQGQCRLLWYFWL